MEKNGKERCVDSETMPLLMHYPSVSLVSQRRYSSVCLVVCYLSSYSAAATLGILYSLVPILFGCDHLCCSTSLGTFIPILCSSCSQYATCVDSESVPLLIRCPSVSLVSQRRYLSACLSLVECLILSPMPQRRH